jgi:hypothetical protein
MLYLEFGETRAKDPVFRACCSLQPRNELITWMRFNARSRNWRSSTSTAYACQSERALACILVSDLSAYRVGSTHFLERMPPVQGWTFCQLQYMLLRFLWSGRLPIFCYGILLSRRPWTTGMDFGESPYSIGAVPS